MTVPNGVSNQLWLDRIVYSTAGEGVAGWTIPNATFNTNPAIGAKVEVVEGGPSTWTQASYRVIGE